MTRRRLLLIAIAVLAAAPAAVLLGAGAALDSTAVRTRLAEAVEHATGHALQLGGPVRIAWSLTPEVEATDAVLLNGPGYSRPSLARIDRLSARIALLPLLAGTVRIPAIALSGVDVLLERDAAGRGNWQRPDAPAVADGGSPSAPSSRRAVSVGRVTLTDVRVALAGGPALAIPALDFAPAGGPIAGSAAINGVTLAITGTVAADGAVQASAVGGGVAASLVRQPSGALSAELLAPALEAAEPLAGRWLPPLRDLHLVLAVAPGGLLQSVHATSAGATLPDGLTLRDLVIAGNGAGPLAGTATALLGTLPVALALNLPPLPTLVRGGPMPVQLLALADGGSASATGTVEGGSVAGTLSLRIPDLGRTAALAGFAAPLLHDLQLDVRVQPGPGTVLLRGLRATAGGGSGPSDLAGDLAVGTGARPSLRGTLLSHRLVLDGWALPRRTEPASSAVPSASPSAPASPAPAALAPTERPLPWAALQRADMDLQVDIGDAVLDGADLRGLSTHLSLNGGHLRLGPARATAPGGPVLLQVTADAAAAPPTAAVVVRGAGLDAAGLAALSGHPGALSGTLDVDVDLHGSGTTEQEFAATLDGHAGLALIDGEVDNAVIAAVFGPALQATRMPVDAEGRSRLRCFATRIDATDGRLTVAALGLDTTRLRLDASGTIDLRTGAIDLRAHPTIRVGPTGVSVPVHLGGTLAHLLPTLERGGISPGRIGIAIGAVAPDPCGPALAAARDNRPGALPR